MSMFSGFFMGEYIAASFAAAQSMANNHVQMASYEKSRQADPVPFGLLRNALRPTVVQRDRWMCEELGIPAIAEDIQ